MIEALSQLKEALSQLLAALASIPELIEYFIEFVRYWAGLFFLIGITLAVLDIVLAVIWR